MRTKYDYAIMSKKDLHGLTSDVSIPSLNKNAAMLNSVRRSQNLQSLKNLSSLNEKSSSGRLMKLQDIIDKRTSRYDEDY